MEGDLIPDSDHVARYCRRSQLVNGTIKPVSFRLRIQEEDLSVSWLEVFRKENREDEIEEVRDVFNKRKWVFKKQDVFAVLNVGITKGDIAKDYPNRNIEFKHEPHGNDKSHSGIHGLRYDDYLISALIAKSVQETHPAIKP